MADRLRVLCAAATGVTEFGHRGNFYYGWQVSRGDEDWQVRYYRPAMFLSLLQTNIFIAIAWLSAVLISLTVHEFSHALASRLRGDRTAEREGRLTLNPLAHIDWYGFIPLLLLGFGWAKPVPFNPYNLKNPKWDSVLIALAGPGANLVLALVASLALRAFLAVGIGFTHLLLPIFLVLLVILNLSLMLFNIIPVHPLDGSKLFFALFDAPRFEQLRRFVAQRGPQILLVLIFLSLLTNFDVFFFVTRPAFWLCDTLTAGTCLNLLTF